MLLTVVNIKSGGYLGSNTYIYIYELKNVELIFSFRFSHLSCLFYCFIISLYSPFGFGMIEIGSGVVMLL